MSADPHTRAQAAQVLARHRRRRAIQAAARRRAQAAHATAPPATGGSPTQQQGHAAETQASRHLGRQGLRILARNLRCKAGEIDLVARQGATLVFVEVRLRRNPRYGGAAASVNRAKQARLIRAAHYFLPSLSTRYFGGRPPPCRFDVLSIEGTRIDWIQDAFRV